MQDNWISVKDKHFVDLTINEDESYKWVENNNCPDEPFLVAVSLKDGTFDIEKVVLSSTGLCCHSDYEQHHYSYSIIDVSHWMPITPPTQ